MSALPRPLAEDLAEARAARRLSLARPASDAHTSEGRARLVDGEAFVRAEPERVPAVWGTGQAVLWAEGEATWIVGPQGVGKTTLAHQLLLRRLGIRRAPLLGHPVAASSRRVLYVAMDRPRQAARSLARMVGPDDAAALRERLLVWRGPPPFDLVADPDSMAAFARDHKVGTVFLDSAKDAAHELSRDEVGSRFNAAVQSVVASGIELVVNHHQKKAQADNRQPRALADVYGSTWLTAGAGSVVLLWGDPGDPVVELRHLKQPAEEVGPLTLLHDHDRGVTELHGERDLAELVAAAAGGLSAPDAARAVYETSSPRPADVQKVRRKLERLAGDGVVERVPASAPDPVLYLIRERESRG